MRISSLIASTIFVVDFYQTVEAFQPSLPTFQKMKLDVRSNGASQTALNAIRQTAAGTSSDASSTRTVKEVEESVSQLKKVLEKEYISFFDPMERDYYAESVTFDDPLNDLEGVDAYQNNVDMLSGRTLLGSLLFKDAGINLHTVTGGDVTQNENGEIEIGEITTRWTLRFTFKALPWSPTPRFSGISKYEVAPGGPKGVQILKQTDYWDSINMIPGGSYQSVDKGVAISHFIDQIKPGTFQAKSAGPELPYQTLRLGTGYEVRRYPSFSAVQMEYERRDEAFSAMGSFTQDMNPMAPAIIQVKVDKKIMMWPLDFALPGQESPPVNKAALEKASKNSDFDIVTVPASVVAIQRFSDAIVEPVVRRVDKELRQLLDRDGLVAADDSAETLTFAQYDAVFSMGQRRSEVRIQLQDGGHPW